MNRRGFFKACGKTAIAAATANAALRPGLALAHLLDDAPRAKLVDREGAPIRASALKPHQTLVFNYPYVATPAMLIPLAEAPEKNLRTEDAEHHDYSWPGGVGPDGNIVAYAAICAHAMSYIGHETAFLNYVEAENDFGFSHAITCCAHGSVYDPARGAAVLKGPAEYPLATIVLEHDAADDSLTATGVIGTELFKKFYDAYRKELREEYGRKKYRKTVETTALALPIEEYSEDVLEC